MQATAHRFEEWILGSLTSGIVAIDQAGSLVTLNAGAQRILGCPRGEPDAAIGRDCREVLRSQPAVARLLIDTLDGRAPLSRAELVLDGDAGPRNHTIGFTLAPVRDGDGRIRGAAILFRDLTPFERGDEQERLRERLAALGQMAAGMAHEIRNPLASMEVLAGLLKRRLEDRPEELALLSQLRSELRAVADSITASLEFVRPVSLSRRPVDVRELVEQSLRTATGRVPFAGEIERRYAPDLPELLVDPELLRGVVTNLILNALEAMNAPQRPARLLLCVKARLADPAARPVRVGADGQAAASPAEAVREIAIAVSDTGPGVPEALREKIFYPFFTTKERGSGVGLALAQKFVASHGGVLELESVPGVGATFRVRIPVSGEGGA
ncbi:MAG TPA: ATP-binding protein [Myxococcota bacterium]|jgi:nitrogen-specific signal transduction histidine kinase